MPKKYFHIVSCPLSKRQRFLYEDYIGRRNTREQLASGSFLSMMGVLMQLRKVCNHPDLFETRPITTPFVCERIEQQFPRLAWRALSSGIRSHSVNRAVFETSDLSDEAMEAADWRKALLIFPEGCRTVDLWNHGKDTLCEREMRGSALGWRIANELAPKAKSFIDEVLCQQNEFSLSNPLLREIEDVGFNYRYGNHIDSR